MGGKSGRGAQQSHECIRLGERYYYVDDKKEGGRKGERNRDNRCSIKLCSTVFYQKIESVLLLTLIGILSLIAI